MFDVLARLSNVRVSVFIVGDAYKIFWGMESSSEIKMKCVGHNEIESPIYEEFIEKNKCLRTNGMLENELVY